MTTPTAPSSPDPATTLSTHVLDSGRGAPAAGLALSLHTGTGELLATAETDTDGRVRFELPLDAGDHQLRFETGAWFEAAGRAHLHPWVTVAFAVGAPPDADPPPHLHVALLLGPWSYTTYRGS